MSSGTRLIIGILAIAAIGFGVSTAMKTENSKETSNTGKNATSNTAQYVENKDKEENKKNNVVENEIVVENEVEDEVVGKEEEESKEENVGLSNEQRAIKLAQDEWAISISSYNFQARLISGAIYEVTVISNDSNRTTVAVYTVDVEKGTVTE